jgi:signal transduction histidine kinase
MALTASSSEQFTAAVCATLSRLQSDRALAESSRIKDEFLAMLGHELRNPLAPIVTAQAHEAARYRHRA